MATSRLAKWFLDHASWDFCKETLSGLLFAGVGGSVVTTIFHLVPTLASLSALIICLVGVVWVAKIRTARPALVIDEKPKPDEGDLTIHWATWGPNDAEAKDVTEEVRQRAHRKWINIPIENAVFGDPTPGTGKHFTVLYSITKKKIIPERPVPVDRLVLPEPEVGPSAVPGGPSGPG